MPPLRLGYNEEKMKNSLPTALGASRLAAWPLAPCSVGTSADADPAALLTVSRNLEPAHPAHPLLDSLSSETVVSSCHVSGVVCYAAEESSTVTQVEEEKAGGRRREAEAGTPTGYLHPGHSKSAS